MTERAFAPTLVGGEVDGQQHDVLIAGDDEGTNQKVSQLGRLIEETCALVSTDLTELELPLRFQPGTRQQRWSL
jgi:predicted dinucleotide-binding enzyme